MTELFLESTKLYLYVSFQSQPCFMNLRFGAQFFYRSCVEFQEFLILLQSYLSLLLSFSYIGARIGAPH